MFVTSVSCLPIDYCFGGDVLESVAVPEPVAPGAAGSEVVEPLASGVVAGGADGEPAALGSVLVALESDVPVPDMLEPDALEPGVLDPEPAVLLVDEASEPAACSSPPRLQPVAAIPKSATKSAALEICAIAFMIVPFR